MSLNKDKIIANAKKYFETANKHGFMTEELMNFLGEDFISSPASTTTNYKNAFEGGLVEHLLRVAFYAVKFNSVLPAEKQVPMDSLLKVCLLHQIGKSKVFKPCESEWHIKNQGKMYEFKEGLVSMRMSERSLYYAMSHGVNFTEEEFAAILNFDKTDDLASQLHNSILGELLKVSNIFANKH